MASLDLTYLRMLRAEQAWAAIVSGNRIPAESVHLVRSWIAADISMYSTVTWPMDNNDHSGLALGLSFFHPCHAQVVKGAWSKAQGRAWKRYAALRTMFERLAYKGAEAR